MTWFSFNGYIYLEAKMSEDLNRRTLRTIANEILKDWPLPNFAARPYLGAMSQLDTMQDVYYEDSARMVVIYFLSNATSWRGETARRIKAELKGML